MRHTFSPAHAIILAACTVGCATGTGTAATTGTGSGGHAGSTTSASSSSASSSTATSGSSSTAASSSGTGGTGGSTSASASTSATSSSNGVGGNIGAPITGCADGTREGFGDTTVFKAIAACDGAWDQPGIFNMPAMCNRQAGNTGVNAAGTGCSVSDLCQTGWHVCLGRDDVLFRNPNGCAGVMTGAVSPVFFTTQMSSTGAFECSTAADATNDLFGCGDLGCDFTSNATVQMLCAPLGLSSHDLCKGLRNDLGCGDWCNHLGKYPALPNAWDCGTDTTAEALHVTKTHADQQGGVLCCLD